MKRFRVYGTMTASKDLGEFSAESKEEAIEMAWNSGDTYCSLCHQCADEIELDEICELRVEETE